MRGERRRAGAGRLKGGGRRTGRTEGGGVRVENGKGREKGGMERARDRALSTFTPGERFLFLRSLFSFSFHRTASPALTHAHTQAPALLPAPGLRDTRHARTRTEEISVCLLFSLPIMPSPPPFSRFRLTGEGRDAGLELSVGGRVPDPPGYEVVSE